MGKFKRRNRKELKPKDVRVGDNLFYKRVHPRESSNHLQIHIGTVVRIIDIMYMFNKQMFIIKWPGDRRRLAEWAYIRKYLSK